MSQADKWKGKKCNPVFPNRNSFLSLSVNVYHLLLMRIYFRVYRNTCTYHYTILWILHFHTRNNIIPNINPVFYIFCLKVWTSLEFRHINLNWTVILSTFKNMTICCSKIPWLFPDFFQNFKFPWLNSKFPDISLTLNFFQFSLTFPWPWEPCLTET